MSNSTKNDQTNQNSGNDRVNTLLQQHPIAVIGMSALFPQSANLQEYWDNILAKIDCMVDVPEDRWDINDYYDGNQKAPDKTYCKKGGFLPDIDFNPMEFGLPPNILEVTDVSQLLGLIVAKDCMEDAGYGENSSFDRSHTGCILGVGGGQKLAMALASRLQYPVWEKVLLKSGISPDDTKVIIEKIKKAYVPWEENSFPGMLGNVIAGRIANRLNLGGTNCVIDAACASSLGAFKMAVSDLLEFRSDMMITGGVDTDNSIFMYMSFSKTPAFTKKDIIQPFDEESKGMMVGEGLGMVALKRLSDAERDNDRIYAVIKGIGSSSDGKFKSIYAPRPSGQARALTRAYEDAGINPSTVGLIEAHGTGTAAGDAAEFGGLNAMFSRGSDKKNHIGLGSVKSQIGHTKAAAGAAGFIKMALALHHKILPPTINVNQPSSKLGIENSPFYINSETRPWIKGDTEPPRRAGVSAFGFGGTNFHIVLEEHGKQPDKNARVQSVENTLLFSGEDVNALSQNLQLALDNLNTNTTQAYLDFCIQNKLKLPPTNQPRLGFTSSNIEDAKEKLSFALSNLESLDKINGLNGVYFRSSAIAPNIQSVALFSGQGSQYLNMGSDLLFNFTEMQEVFTKMDDLYLSENKSKLSAQIYPKPVFNDANRQAQTTNLQQTQNAQPAIGLISMGLFKILQNSGFSANYSAGHSFGELSALWSAGVMSDGDYLTLAKARGEAMAAPNDLNFDAGTMLAVMGDVAQIIAETNALNDVSVANYNSAKQVVIAGTNAGIANAKTVLKAKGFSTVNLPVSAAFHTNLVAHAQAPFASAISKVQFNAPKNPVYANATAQVYPNDGPAITKLLSEQILNPVLFKDQIENMYDAGARVFVEFGPKNVLTKLTQNILKGKDFIAVALNGSYKKSADKLLRKAVIELAVAGCNLSHFDLAQYQVKSATERKKSPVNVSLNGGMFMSDKTKKAYTDSFNDGFLVSLMTKSADDSTIALSNNAQSQNQAIAPVLAENISPINGPLNGANNSALKKIDEQAKEVLENHQQFLNNHQEYFDNFYKLNQKQSELLNNGGNQEIPKSIKDNLALFHQNYQETLRVHENYLSNQSDNSNKALSLAGLNRASNSSSAPVSLVAPVVSTPIVQTPIVQAPVIPEPQPVAKVAPATSQISQALKNDMLAVVSDKTGYPTEMIELTMDLEADLGIDSIKRVEILGSIMSSNPQLQAVNPDDLSDLRTLGEILDHLQATLGKSKQAVVSPTPQVIPTPQVAVQTVAPVAPATSQISQALKNDMLAVVSDKTGYPTEMIELTMDLEADLGIDSIKRVEILGSIMSSNPQLQAVNPDDLSDLRTLGEILDHLQATLGKSTQAVVSPTPQVIPTPQVAVQTVAPVAPATSEISQALKNDMLAVVSDKTGYPTEMIELTMDLEADLGIDSIKRVEILGSIMSSNPQLQAVNPDDLSDLRTLGEILDHLQATLGKSKQAVVSPTPQVIPTPQVAVQTVAPVAPATSQISQALKNDMLAVVSDKTGYPTEMIELTMDLEADLGIDSIKRVEILGSIMSSNPDLQAVNPDDLSDLRTLGEILDHLQATLGKSTQAVVSPTPQVAVQTVAPVAPATSQISQALKNDMLAVVSDKTGYPTEMIELTMDLEADLGIDSIKRVEILGSIMSSNPQLQAVNPDDLSDLRTLGEILDHLQATLGKSTQAVVNSTSGGTPAMEETEQTDSLVNSISNHSESSKKILTGLNEAVLTQIPAADRLELSFANDTVCLISDDGTVLSVSVAKKLKSLGITTILLGLPATITAKFEPLVEGIDRIILADESETELQSKLKHISTSYGKIASFIYLSPIFTKKADKGIYNQKSKSALTTLFLIAKHLKADLNEASANTRNSFIAVSRMDGFLGFGKTDYDLITGGLFGLVKTLKLEWEYVFCRAVDISAKTSVAKSVEYILAELADSDQSISECAYNSQARFSLSASKMEGLDTFENDNLIDQNSLFVVSGGAKGVTAKCVIELSKYANAKFILMGRSELISQEPSWAVGITDEPQLKNSAMQFIIATGNKPTPKQINTNVNAVLSSREINSNISQIEANGAKAYYISADVKDSNAIKTAIENLGLNLTNITGIIHGAGVLADKPIEKKTLKDFNKVFSTKIEGLEAILSLISVAQIKHLLLFSSAAGFYGNAGQADYAIANDILNKTAHYFRRKYKKCHVVSFNWGPWDGGMVDSTLKKMFKSKRIALIPLDEGAEIFAQSSTSKNYRTQLLVGSSMKFQKEDVGKHLKTYKITRSLNLKDNPFLKDHVIGGKPVLPTVCVMEWLAKTCEKLYSGYHFFSIDDYKMFKGIVFESASLGDFNLDISEISKSKETILFKTKISSKGNKNLNVNHYSANITLVRDLPQSELVNNIDYSENNPIEGPTLYDSGTLFHGPLFQAVEKVFNISKEGLTLRCHVPDVPLKSQGQFITDTFNPYTADVQFQAMLIWVRHFYNAGSLPSKALKIEQFRAIKHNSQFFVTLKTKQESSTNFKADIFIHDKEGKLYSRVIDAEVTVSKQLNSLFTKHIAIN